MKNPRSYTPLSRLRRLALAAVLALTLAPSAAFADDAASEAGIVEQVDAANQEAFAEFEATGNVNALFNTDAYNYPEGAAAALAGSPLPPKLNLVDRGVVTPVKFQNPWGTCWAFGATAASETSILSELGTTYDEFPLDLSERHLAWMTKTPLADGSSQDGEGIHTMSLDPAVVMNQGGWPFEATSIYSSGIGPVPESEVPYRNDEKIVDPNGLWYSTQGTWSVDESLRFGQMYRLEESAVLPSPANNGPGVMALKQELNAGHAVEIAFAADQYAPGQPGAAKYINTANNLWAHYTYEDAPATHAVCIVGYDDTYSKDNFLPGHQPPGDGAWIVKNSWGAMDQDFPNKYAWGIDGNGYFMISYFDKSMVIAETFDYNVDDPHPELAYWLVNQYDYMPTGGVVKMTFSSPTSMANAFAASERMNVTAVSCETTTPGTTATYEMYLLKDGASDPTDGVKVGSFQRTYDYGGYHREELDQPFVVEEGQSYSVVVTLQAAGTYEVVVQQALNKEGTDLANQSLPEGSKYDYYTTGIVNKGESFALQNGAWEDWALIVEQLHATSGGKNFDYDNFAIKAFGDPAPQASVPDLSGMTEAEALAALEAAGLAGVAGEAEYSDTVEAGRVVRQDVAAGTKIDQGSAVTYILSLGKAPLAKASVPDLSGMTEADALAALKAAGLAGVAGEAEYSDTVEAGRVVRQGVAAGTEVDQGSAVTYILSLGKKEAVAGKSLTKTGDPLVPTATLAGVCLVAAGAAVLGARRRSER